MKEKGDFIFMSRCGEAGPCISGPRSYGVGVLQAAVLPLIQDVEASALIVRTVGRAGNLIHRKELISTVIRGSSYLCLTQQTVSLKIDDV